MEVLCAVIQRQRFAFKAFGSATLHNVLLCLIAHGRADIAVAQEVLDGRQVHAGFEQVSGKCVALIPGAELAS